MIARTIGRLRWPLLGAGMAALVLAATSGATHLGSLQLGHANSSTDPTLLTANLANPVFKVVNQGSAAALRGDAANGIGVNGVSVSGTGQQGESQTGIGLAGSHKAVTGTNPGVQGSTASTDPLASGVLAKNTGGGAGLRSIVNAGAPPLLVNSNVKVTNLNVDLLDGLDSTDVQKRVTGTCDPGSAIRVVNDEGTVSCEPVGGAGTAWNLTGNAGTTPGPDFLGTSDNQALELKVNGQRALRLEPRPGIPNLIGGSAGNSVSPGVDGAFIGGGGFPGFENTVTGGLGTVGGGWRNTAGGWGTVGGGEHGTASANFSAVGGGQDNTASGNFSAVGGGEDNTAGARASTVAGGTQNAATGESSAVAGGDGNSASGSFSAVPGGFNNTAGDFSFAAGALAKATQPGSFVWGDQSAFVDLISPAANTFTVRASGGIWLGTTSSPSITAGHFIETDTGAYLTSAGVWTDASDRALKHEFGPLNTRGVLEKVARMPITSWSYKKEQPSIRHIGPMAQDFYKTFGLGLDNKHITTIDEGGVALAAIQGLYRENQALKRKNAALSARLTRLESAVAALGNGRKPSQTVGKSRLSPEVRPS